MGFDEKKKNISKDDTIAAIITPPGEGGIGAIRISGPETPKVIRKIFRPADPEITPDRFFHLYYGHIINNQSNIIDEVTMVQMPQGQSYTGQNQAEIFCHGGQYVLKQILEVIYGNQVRPAEPGEFTRRAFLAGRIDLAKAEAVADLIASKTEYSYHAAMNNLLGRMTDYIDSIRSGAIALLAEIEVSVDYPEEGLEAGDKARLLESIDTIIFHAKELSESYRAGQIIKEGFKIAIAGRPNAGKSSLFNLMLNQNRAIVAPTPGTTRDYLTEWIDMEGAAVSITDTAGLRAKGGQIEKAGQVSAKGIINDSDLVIWIVDISRKEWKSETIKDINEISKDKKTLVALNKIDKIGNFDKSAAGSIDCQNKALKVIPMSCKTDTGFKLLRKELIKRINESMPDLTDRLVVTSARHKKKLDDFLAAFGKARKNIVKEESPELIAFELRSGINQIDEITGRIYNDEILENIFSRFCIGK
ncbi:MAG: tRNA uridine-5-carboxymethylaminomethyl(34) synthesis GTPase MnmE [candidate division Zixibacteria bacterium HGW-Zixibacteria-1]|nr:MAG: tRNA uridine-5-carboxymethylaminomethyl(34) synthesis GTPase MnmE [candidate division Zixibacteria bacterium HGW-Zixibacteria-1]